MREERRYKPVSVRLSLAERYREIVKTRLQKHVPERPVWAFGSRTFGRARRYSDLPIGETAKLRSGMRLELRNAFDESMLPIEVDVVDLNDVDSSFRTDLECDFLQLQPFTLKQGETRA